MSDILPVHHRPLRVRKVHSLRTFIWLAKGARDFARAPLVGLSHGLVMAGFGALMGRLAGLGLLVWGTALAWPA